MTKTAMPKYLINTARSTVFVFWFQLIVGISAISVKAASSAPAIVPTGDIGLPTVDSNGSSIPDPIKYQISSYYDTAITVIYYLVGAVAVIYLLWSGIQYIMSNGDAEKAKKARTGVINAVIGIVIVVSAYTIINIGFGIGKKL